MKKFLVLCLFTGFFLDCTDVTSDVTEKSPEIKQLAANNNAESIPSGQQTTIMEVPTKPKFSADYIMGKFNPEVDDLFEEIPVGTASRKGMYMRKEALKAFLVMADSAKNDGINLQIISATRNFFRQKQIWEAKWTGARLVDKKDLSKSIKDPVKRAQKILEFSSMPGTSRHHWGTDIDINNLKNKYFEKGKGLKEYDWLNANAKKYGFCQTYTAFGKDRPHGYHEEKWHWSYKPLSKEITNTAKRIMSNDNITGFLGSETAKEIDVLNKYILGVNPNCSH